jgi:4-hydroxy-3-polyprenylbenzoate decarboxylase
LKLVVAITGASGVKLGERFIEYLPKGIELHTIVSQNGSTVGRLEEGRELILHENSNIASSIASGSFGVDAMAIIPCSMNSLAKIACGISDNLVTRVASVMLKEQRRLLLAPREMPLSPIMLENMEKLSKLNVTIAPPIMGYYSNPQSLEEMERFIIGKWYDVLGIEHSLYERWKG